MDSSMFPNPLRWAPFVVLTALAACSQVDAHRLMRGTVVMKVAEREAHVCLGDGEVQAGDRLVVQENVCRDPPVAPWSKAGGARCEKVEVGGAEVVRTLNEHYSVVRFDEGVPFREGTLVEK